MKVVRHLFNDMSLEQKKVKFKSLTGEEQTPELQALSRPSDLQIIWLTTGVFRQFNTDKNGCRLIIS